MKHINKIVGILILTILILISYLFISTHSIEKQISKSINDLFVHHVKEVSKNIEKFIKGYFKNNLYEKLKSDEKLREYLQNSLSLTAASPHNYVYILYRDKKGRYRYLLDGSNEDRGEFDQKLDVDQKSWDEVYYTTKDKVIIHKSSEFIYITYLRPIIIDSKVEGVIAVDFTSELPATISQILNSVKSIFNYIFLTFLALFLILLYQYILYLKTKKYAITDSLTQVYNRVYLRNFLENINPNNYAILMLDIDHFKNINDTYGHKAGDFILREFANILKTILREEDIIVRYGGEEFLVFLKKPENEKEILKVAERIRKTIENFSYEYENYQINITVSIGITLHPERFKTIKEAIKIADEMLYKAKRGGRNKVVWSKKENFIEITYKDIYFVKEAIDENRVVCYFQPIYNIKNNKIVKYEALVRLLDKNSDLIYPGAFLEKIVYTTIYNSLTKKVLNIIFEKIEKTKKNISVNLNLSDITDNMVFSIILKEIENNLALSKYLTIELLENESLTNQKELGKRLEQLKSYGVKVAIDDFGSGYSNFEIFRFLPIDILKIDGSLIKEIENSKISYSIVKSITLFAKDLDIDIVAEFVENEKILKILENLEITYAQGFYLGKPSKL
ncbi:bifunctional diguanylate cyclase/phosphodiesterase [Nitrosophilus labii]|uniref:bifunctional diguanylate cyclase/phosphodiesterase n=1 Tax=Nitrosophilus labii TaxID=2706014 RepID=UPI001657149B|nr:bifunctional diguanylate cyclase/phosphodiesterase [Nitrosophilus labii]